MTHIWRDGKRSVIQMHRLIVNPPRGVIVDHRDRDGLNNQRDNLRIATRADNRRNSVPQKNNASGLKGVYWKVDHQKWSAQIRVGARLRTIGYYGTAGEAARAYDAAAREAFGEFARCNFPEERPP